MSERTGDVVGVSEGDLEGRDKVHSDEGPVGRASTSKAKELGARASSNSGPTAGCRNMETLITVCARSYSQETHIFWSENQVCVCYRNEDEANMHI
jgi:hypothetical protein